MARTSLTLKQLFNSVFNRVRVTALQAKLAEHDTSLDYQEGISARSGAGAIAITAMTCYFTSTGAGNALTIADGATGQRLRIVHTVKGSSGTGVVTQTSGAKLSAGVSTITLTNRFDWVDLQWTGTLWEITGYYGATIA